MSKIDFIYEDSSIRIWVYPSGIIETNFYILSDKYNNVIFIDPAIHFIDEFNILYNFIDNDNLIPSFILNTHGHFDHISGIDKIREKYSIPLMISEIDSKMITDSSLNFSKTLSLDIKLKEADIKIKNEEIIFAGEMDIKPIFTPGHTRGSVCYLVNNDILFSGDILFKLSIGKCFSIDDLKLEKKMIKEKLFSLNDKTIVFPGHGDKTTIGEEKASNPFVGCSEG